MQMRLLHKTDVRDILSGQEDRGVGKLRKKDGHRKKYGRHRRTHGDLGGDMGAYVAYVGLSTG